MHLERLDSNNIEQYIEYLERAVKEEPDMMWTDHVDEQGIRSRVQDSFFQNTRSVLAFEDNHVVGRIEYHFYGCLQDGYRMAYVDWVYVLEEYRHKGVARKLFAFFENDCRDNGINQYYLIRAKNKNAVRFYDSFEGAESEEELVLRKTLKE